MLGAYVQVHNEEIRPMALSGSALSELLDALRAGDGIDLVCDLFRLVCQELVEAEVTSVIGAVPTPRPLSDGRVAHAPHWCHHRPGW